MVKVLGISPTPQAVQWVLYDRSFERVYLAGIARLTTDDRVQQDLALESWLLAVLDQYARLPGIQEVVLELKPDGPRLSDILRRRCRAWQLKVTELPTDTILTRVVGRETADDAALASVLRARFSTVLDRLEVAHALAAALAWTPTRFSLFGRKS